ncbi:MAG TPA: membrane dipeptidase [Acidimicrobiales bacterium]|nr:membrane dipeptidase [Acidimicrobiales bacterium]
MVGQAERAQALGISKEAVEIWDASEVVDAHVESFVWSRVAGYDLARRHGNGALGGSFYSQADLPRMVDAGFGGAVLSVATNPFRRRHRRTETLLANLARLQAAVVACPHAAVVADHAAYRRARQNGHLACFLAVQGGNALGSPADLELVPDDVVSRITLVHLTASPVGASSAPGLRRPGRGRGLTPLGAELVEAMNARRVLVDLAHISPRGFWDALDVHDRAQPAIVSHTGVRGVHDHWRNVDDAQLRAIAELAGVVGVMLHSSFLGDRFWSGRADAVVDHLTHVVRIAGEDTAAIGSDFDGLIVPPADLRTVTRLPVLVQRMLDRRFGPERIAKVLGGNYLRVVAAVRPGGPPPTGGATPAS